MRANRVLSIMAILIVAYSVWIFLDPGRIPRFDANNQQLAETEAEAYCAGYVFTYNTPQPEAAKECRDRTRLSTDINLAIVQSAACKGYFDKQNVPAPDEMVAACAGQLQQMRAWITMDGVITTEWNRANPYPGDLIGPAGDGSRGASDGSRGSEQDPLQHDGE